jgi:L-seryl-tRNA(Ser) seleniumtransferase
VKNELHTTKFRALPSVDRLLQCDYGVVIAAEYGSQIVTETLRNELKNCRELIKANPLEYKSFSDEKYILRKAESSLENLHRSLLRPVFNLTGTVLHTNLGRAPLPQEAIDEVKAVMQGASNVEFNLSNGKRGDRDDFVESWLTRLTGAEAATVVNNNAAAVLLVLNSLARRKEVPVSRGELVEIGGSFRIPDVMARAGSKLVEVGTTNRTHLADFTDVMSTKTGLVMKIHTSNYIVQGFTASVSDGDLSRLARQHDVPFVNDLGSGTLLDFSKYGLPKEQTAFEAIQAGADLITFSGDKLLGGPQCGIIAGKADLIKKIKGNALKRALRVDKLTLAALNAVLKLYGNPDTLAQKLPSLRLLSRSQKDIQKVAEDLAKPLQEYFSGGAVVSFSDCKSQIGSGAMPIDILPSCAVKISLASSSGKKLVLLAKAFRELPIPVVGRIHQDAFFLDMRCLEREDEERFVGQIAQLNFRF